MITYTKAGCLLGIEHVDLAYGAKVVLRDVCATVEDVERDGATQGQVVCFLGPSGIGKTRLSRLIAGLDAPTRGRITLANGQPTEAGRVGMVPQNYPLFEFATVRENLAIAARQSAVRGARSAPELCAQLDIAQYLDAYPAQLSGGTRQRVAIVRQLLCAGYYLVLDEPFSGLDPNLKAKATALIAQIAALDTLNTIIIVTHDVTEGMSIADTVWLMGLEQAPDYTWQPGARIVDQYDLAALGLAWRPDIAQDATFQALVRDVKARFRTLAP